MALARLLSFPSYFLLTASFFPFFLTLSFPPDDFFLTLFLLVFVQPSVIEPRLLSFSLFLGLYFYVFFLLFSRGRLFLLAGGTLCSPPENFLLSHGRACVGSVVSWMGQWVTCTYCCDAVVLCMVGGWVGGVDGWKCCTTVLPLYCNVVLLYMGLWVVGAWMCEVRG